MWTLFLPGQHAAVSQVLLNHLFSVLLTISSKRIKQTADLCILANNHTPTAVMTVSYTIPSKAVLVLCQYYAIMADCLCIGLC